MTQTDSTRGTTFATPSDVEVVVTRVVAAPRRLVFEAHTNPTHVRRWLLGPEGWTMPVCEIDLRVGGAWRYVWRNADGGELEIRGVYQEIVPPERLVSSELWGGDWPETLTTIQLTEEDGRTKITQRVRYPSQQARDAALRTGMVDGMAAGYDRLDAYLATQE